MKINLSNDDKKIILDYLNCNDLGFDCSVYSKIVVQFDDESEFERFEDDDVDTDCFVICHEFDANRNQYIMYSIDKNAFTDAVEIFDEYSCSVYQFIIDEDNNTFIRNTEKNDVLTFDDFDRIFNKK